MTRWAKFRQSIWRYSALRNRMRKVQAELAEAIVCMSGTSQRGKYASVAYHFCEFNDNGDVKTFHIENRIADGALSAAVVTAWAMLTYALVLKAVRLSQYGIMEVGDNEYRAAVERIRPHLIDGEMREWGGCRTADTSELEHHTTWLRENAMEMLNFLKPELSNLGPAYDILLSLADRPCSVRLVQGQTWPQIEETLMGGQSEEVDQDAEDEIREIVDLAGIVDCGNLDVWLEEVSAYLGQPPEQVSNIVYRLINSGRCCWSAPIGAVITS